MATTTAPRPKTQTSAYAAALAALRDAETRYTAAVDRAEALERDVRRAEQKEQAMEVHPMTRRAAYDQNEPVLGKTGTCTDPRSSTHLGWFGSFNDVNRNKLVVVVMLTGGRAMNGPVASGVAGSVYRQLSTQHYFAAAGSPPAVFSTSACCGQ